MGPLNRRTLLPLAFGAAALPLLWWTRTAQQSSARSEDIDRAVLSYQAMQRHFYLDDGSALYREFAQDPTPATLWPFSQALIATLSMFGMPGVGATYLPDVNDRLVALERFWHPPAYSATVTPSDHYFDDNAWVGLALIWHQRATGDSSRMPRARELFDFIASGWDHDPTHPLPGGVFWVRQTPDGTNHDRNTVSTAGGSVLGLQLAESDPSTVDWARRMHDWTDQNLRDPADGLYVDRVDLEGRIDPGKAIYKQGLMVASHALLYRHLHQSGDPSAPQLLDRAETIARTVLEQNSEPSASFAQSRVNLSVRAASTAIYFRFLLVLAAITGRAEYGQTARAYAERIWATQRDSSTGLFDVGPPGPPRLLDQAAMTQVYALLAWNPADYWRLA